MTSSSPSPPSAIAAPRRPPWRDTALLFAVACAVYVALRQEALHGVDVHGFLDSVYAGEPYHHHHTLYLRLAIAAATALAPLGLEPLDALCVLSACGAATAVAIAHRVFGRVAARLRAAAAAAWLAATPGLMFFATVAEVHAAFLPFAMLSLWLFVARRGRALRGLVTGLSVGIAASVHATGHLLTPLWLVWYLATEADRRAVRARLAGSMIAGHVAAALAVGAATAGGEAAAANQAGFVLEFARHFSASQSPLAFLDAAVREWLLPFAPVSLLALAALARRDTARPAAVVCAGAAGYVLLSAILLLGADEHGAYQLPLAALAALLAARVLPGDLAMAGAVLTALASAVWLHAQDRPHHDPARAQTLSEMAAERPMFFIFDGRREVDTIVRYRVQIPGTSVHDLAASLAPLEADAAATQFDALVTGLAASGRTLCFSRGALDRLRRVDHGPVGQLARQHLPNRYALRGWSRGGVHLVRVEPR